MQVLTFLTKISRSKGGRAETGKGAVGDFYRFEPFDLTEAER